MQEKDNGSIELLLVLDSILQVRVDMRPALHQQAAACRHPISRCSSTQGTDIRARWESNARVAVAASSLPCAAQAVGLQDVQGLLQTCSASFSRWFMAHVTPLLGRHPAATVMARALEHFGSDQVRAGAYHAC